MLQKIFITAALILLSQLLYSQTGAEKKFLVLGFQSKHINDLQDRILREELMRELLKSGSRIVTVMELESLYHDETMPIKDFRYFKDPVAVSLNKKFKADYTVFGKITNKTRHTGPVAEGQKYRCSLKLYISKENRFSDIFFEIDGSSRFIDFAQNFSKKSADEIYKLIKEK